MAKHLTGSTEATVEYELKWLIFGCLFPYLEFRMMFDKGAMISKRQYFLNLTQAQTWVRQLGPAE